MLPGLFFRDFGVLNLVFSGKALRFQTVKPSRVLVIKDAKKWKKKNAFSTIKAHVTSHGYNLSKSID